VRFRIGIKGMESGRSSLMPWLVGSLLAAAAAYALTAPIWRDRAEGLASDFLFRFGRLNPPRADERIVHVDIDDGSLESLGRWPWRRADIALAVKAIDALGPSVIAFDILFDEPDRDRPEDDQALVDAIANAKAKTVVAIKFPPTATEIGPLWQGPEGSPALRRVLDALKADITLNATTLIDEAQLDEPRARRVRDRFQSFRELAIEQSLRESSGGLPPSVEALLSRLVPASKRDLRWRGIEMTVGKVVDRERVARHLAERLTPLGSTGIVPLAERMEAPLLDVAMAADECGFVTTGTDRDGAIRRVPPFMGFAGRVYPQLGIAAAMAHLRAAPGSVALLEDAVAIGPTTLPLSSGRTLIAWPRLDDGSPPLNLLTGRALRESHNAALGLLRQRDDDPPSLGHVAIGHVLDLHRRHERLAEKHARYDQASRDLIDSYLWEPEEGGYSPEDWNDQSKQDELKAQLLKLVAENLPRDSEGLPSSPGEDPSGRLKLMWLWYLLHTSLPDEEHELAMDRRRAVDMVRGKIVFVGFVTTGSLSDVYPTAAGPLTPGVVVNAMMANMVLSNYAFRESPLWIGALMTFLLGSFAAFVAGIRSIRPLLGLLLAGVIALGYLFVNSFYLFDSLRLFLPLATPMAGIGLGLFGSTFSRGLHERRERSRLTRQFGNRIHRRLFEYLIEHPDVIDMSGAQREVTCMFGDLAGFTSVSESMDSRSTVALLNRYMGSMNALLTEHEAYVNKFLGDGVMAFWGAFEEDPSHADRAVRAAIACVQRVEELNLEASRNGQPRLTMRFGLSSGSVTVGDCGAPPEFSDFTVIGDSVNLAARLETANKQFGTSILINARTNEMLGADVLRRPVGLVTVVGQSKPVELFEVLPVEPGTEDEEILALVESTAGAVRLYRDRRLDEAQAAWEQLIAQHGQSRLAALYLAEIARFKANADELFDGVIRLATK